MEITRKNILLAVFWLLLAVCAVIYWRITLLVFLASAGAWIHGITCPTPAPPYRKGYTPDEEWDDYEHQRYDRINKRRRIERRLETQQRKDLTERVQRIALSKDNFFNIQEDVPDADTVPALQKNA